MEAKISGAIAVSSYLIAGPYLVVHASRRPLVASSPSIFTSRITAQISLVDSCLFSI
jgi:hypothetical protein